ncbi:hypothetical protein GDO78_000816 [Eleutherodactylus coqui]|uniref:Uncharacterized protein n=1 Tax=Eleutherodactylus coqui TaxID=57060 RepID=A0A8J6FTH3_ELECQ|nr:hypothetical protein GDO78_000816 [Eleutherodactylus coqui]
MERGVMERHGGEFLQIYRSFPCLKESNQHRVQQSLEEDEAYQRLIEVAQKHFPSQKIDLRFVKAKIKNPWTVCKK